MKLRSCGGRRSPLVTAALLLLTSFVLLSALPPTQYNGGIVLANAAGKLPRCTDVESLTNYGVNLNFFTSKGAYVIKGPLFCASTAPAQYRCRCSVVKTCKAQSDPWGRNIGYCGGVAPWVAVCVAIAVALFLVSLLLSLHQYLHGRWWYDGYLVPLPSLMPRRGPAVACPASRRLPENLFRGYPSTAFVNYAPAAAQAGEAEVEGAGAAVAADDNAAEM